MQLPETSSETLHFRMEQGLDTSKLLDYSDLAYRISKYQASAHEALTRLKEIGVQAPLYNLWTKLGAFGISSACASLLFFGGGWIDSVFAAVFGLVTGGLCIWLDQYAQFRPLLGFLTALTISFVSFAISTATSEYCPFATALAGIVWLLPGLTIAIAVAELSARCIVSGSARFFGAVIVAMQQGFGLAMGSRLILWAKINDDEITRGCPFRASSWYSPVFLLLISLTFNILLNNRPSQWWSSVLSAFVGWYAFLALSPNGFALMDTNSAVAVAALCVGICGQLIALVTHHQSLVTIMCGILVLVPGGIGVRGAASVFTAKGVDGLSFGLTTVMTGFDICMGLIVAKAMIPSQQPSSRLARQPSRPNPVPIM